LGAAATFDGPTNALLSSRNVNQLPGNSRNRSTFFQKQELALFRSHWQACIFDYVLCPVVFVYHPFLLEIHLCSHSCLLIYVCPHQIIQLASSTTPGRFFAWVVAEGIMFKIPINVPRIFYLNSKAPVTEEFPGRRVKKILPHGRPCFNLIEVNVANSCKVTMG
jgi:DNA polymerase epsilon subunit 1